MGERGYHEGVTKRPAPERLQSLEVYSERFGIRIERARWAGCEVFVKTLTSDMPETAGRFHREGEIAAQLSHPNIVPLLAHTRTQLIYRFVPGESLRARLTRGVMTVQEATGVTRGILSAVAYAHLRGITHLDLKPENVLLEDDRVRVADFGLSHDRDLPRITGLGERMGTPQYMAPEQFEGVRNDARSDVYAISVILFECLTGALPHPDALSWLIGRSQEKVELPPYPPLYPALRAGLSRDPARRPASALALLTLLERAEEELEAAVKVQP